jgi:hypothetical protein
MKAVLLSFACIYFRRRHLAVRFVWTMNGFHSFMLMIAPEPAAAR